VRENPICYLLQKFLL